MQLDIATAVETYRPYVRAVARRYIDHDRSLIDDVEQETWLRLLTKRHLYKPEQGTLAAWLGAIARNVALDLLRRQQTQLKYLQVSEPSEEEQDALQGISAILCTYTNFDENETLAQIKEVLRHLNPDQALILVYCYGLGYTFDEMADKLGIPKPTARSRAFQGKAAFRRVWVALFGSESPLAA